MTEFTQGSSTLPGEAGYETLTLALAKKFGADVIRDSDGTELSSEITDAGYGIYSTICIIREHNEWAAAHPEQLQQTFLMTAPVTAEGPTAAFHLMEDFYSDQFRINDSSQAMKYWQVYDRTTGKEVSPRLWTYEKELGSVIVQEAAPFHQYTVSFLAYRIWEEISMYNHVTNGWEKEHLVPVDPRYPETREYLYQWLDQWCQNHPATTVVRFTSLFYNFVWMWGSSERKRHLFTDWGSYDFTVSTKALEEFEAEYGYRLTAEDFVNQGNFHVTHMPAGKKQKDYMEFTEAFVLNYGKRLVDLVHSYGKQAYVFYDDSWVGLEPYNGHFQDYGFDGLIKCVFSGFEARLCAGADVKVHELRLHPYLFPVGLGGTPTFCEGGNPTRDAKEYWNRVRRALLRVKIDRIGLGGYLHLVEAYPDFCDYMEQTANEFRQVKALHEEGAVYTLPLRTAVLHTWGSLRSWTLSGHFHETYMHDLIHVNEALAGLPVEVTFLSFEDVKNGALAQVDVLINAGAAGTAWSGGSAWEDVAVLESIYEFAGNGGVVIGINQPSAVEGYDTFFRLAPVLGIDEDTGAKVCHGRWSYEVEAVNDLIPAGAEVKGRPSLYLTDGKARVLAVKDGTPSLTVHPFGKGMGIYLSSFQHTTENTRLLLNLMLYGKGLPLNQLYVTDNPYTESAWYPASQCLVVINNSDQSQQTSILTEAGERKAALAPYETKIMDLR